MPRVRQYRGLEKRPSTAPIVGVYKRFKPNDYVGRVFNWEPQTFYDSVHVPPADLPLWPQLEGLAPDGFLDCKLYPFQKRTVQFMMEREGARLVNGDICSPPQVALDDVTESVVRGGILAEEMGLGKTVEVIALMSLHKRPAAPKGCPLVVVDGGDAPRLTSGATLIITPTHLVQQWKDEIALHAPHMRVFHYEGIKRRAKSAHFAHYDVILTTYPVLAAEVWYVNPTTRNLRHAKKYVPPKSPLTEVEWWRVCLDEAQMVETGVSNAAVVARLIPRVNAWAVSGTPFKNQVEDLRGLLHFLRYAPYDNRTVWNNITRDTFERIFGSIAIRHTKNMVRNELHLPQQKRLIISVPFMAIEEQNYSALFAAMCKDIGVHPDGAPLNDRIKLNSDQSIEKMRNWLRRLRQTCLHPQVGGRNRRALGGGNQPLRTVDQVLGAMIKQQDTLLYGCERDVIQAKVMQGHVNAFDKSNPQRAELSLKFYEDALALISPIVERYRAEDKAQRPEKADDEAKDTPAKGLNFDLRMALELSHMSHFYVATAHFQIKEVVVKDSDEYSKREAAEKTYYDAAKTIRQELLFESRQNAEKMMSRVASCEQVLLTEITVPEFSGGIESVKYADQLEDIVDVLNKQVAWLNKWSESARNILLKPLVDADDKDDDTGEEYEDSTKMQDELYILFLALRTVAADRSTLISGQVNMLTRHDAKQAISLAESRIKEAEKRLELGKELVDEELRSGKQTAESASEELAIMQQLYNEATETPRLTLETLRDWDKLKGSDDLGSIRGIVAELRSLLTKLEWQNRNPLSRTDIASVRSGTEASLVEKQLKFIHELATQNTKVLSDLENDIDMFRNCMNQRLVFYKRLQDISDSVKPWKEGLQTGLDVAALVRFQTMEKKARDLLESQEGKRRFLKHLRDHASEDESRICVICQTSFENGVLTACGHQYCKECINAWWSVHRLCPLCKRYLRSTDFQDITYKPREYVAEEEQAANSPLAARRDSIIPGPSSDASRASPASTTLRNRLYAEINKTTLDQIKAIDLPASYGTKIDTLGRQLLWLRVHDPGAKSIVFSQFSDFLAVLQEALTRFGVGVASIHETGGRGVERFRREAAVETFLLDAKSNCSGLNLVNATHVFLCEPLVNPAVELQAVARVHRIGQMRATCVWMCLVQDSVEAAVYDISAARRLAHAARQRESAAGGRGGAQPEQGEGDAGAGAEDDEDPTSAFAKHDAEDDADAAMDAADSLELQRVPLARLLARRSGGAATAGETAGAGGGEIVARDDLFSCLFSTRPPRVGASAASGAVGVEVKRFLAGEAAEARRGV